MAIVQNPLIHRASGSVGNSVFSKWKQKNTLRSKSIMPYPSPSTAQGLARQRFKNCSEFYLPLMPFKSMLFQSKSNNTSALNQFVKTNLSLFADDASIIAIPSISSLVFSTGTIESFFQNSIVPISYLRYYVTGSFLFHYNETHSGCGMLVICVDLTLKDVLIFYSTPPVFNNTEVLIPVARVGHEFFVFVCNVDWNLKKSSTTSFIGSFIAS